MINERVAKALWDILGDVCVDENDYTEQKFLHFPPGTFKEDIWHWFEETLDVPIHTLMFRKIRCSRCQGWMEYEGGAIGQLEVWFCECGRRLFTQGR